MMSNSRLPRWQKRAWCASRSASMLSPVKPVLSSPIRTVCRWSCIRRKIARAVSRNPAVHLNGMRACPFHLAALLPADARCVLAFSGGLDSSVLLHQLVSWQRQRAAARARITCASWFKPQRRSLGGARQQQCQQWHIPCEVLRVQVDARAGGIEAAARTARYQALFSHLQPGEYLPAQHLDDQLKRCCWR